MNAAPYDVTPGLAPDLRRLLERTPHLWKDLRGARVLVTGGTGFVGRWMLESLRAADREHSLGVRCTAVTRYPEAFARRAPELCAWRGLALHRGDVRDFRFPAGVHDHVLHVATVPTPPADGREILDVLLRGTRRLLEAAVNARAERLLVVSSGSVYGPQPFDLPVLAEEYLGSPDPLSPASANGEGKRAAELMAVLEGRAQGISVTTARGFALIGPYLPLDGHFAAGNFLRDVLRGGPVVVTGDGTPVRSYLHATDMAEWLWTIHLRGRNGVAYNFGSDEEVSIGDLALRIAAAHARLASLSEAVEVQITGSALPGKTPERYVPSVRRAREELGLVPSIGLDEGIRRTLSFLMDPAGTGQSNSQSLQGVSI